MTMLTFLTNFHSADIELPTVETQCGSVDHRPLGKYWKKLNVL